MKFNEIITLFIALILAFCAFYLLVKAWQNPELTERQVLIKIYKGEL